MKSKGVSMSVKTLGWMQDVDVTCSECDEALLAVGSVIKYQLSNFFE